MSRWHFNEHQPIRPLRNPISGQFFADDSLDDVAEALIREALQNSLDAASGAGPVHLRIALSEEPERRAHLEAAELVVAGLQDHVSARGNGLTDDRPNLLRLGRYLVLEDFGTRGLEGEPGVYIPTDDSSDKNHFYNFFRAEGLSDKDKDAGGRWGIGKTVFPRASRINAYFGLTVRESDRRALLMGRCILKAHVINGVQFEPDGQFGEPRADIIMPVEDVEVIDKVRRLFRISRTTEPGLSIVVPFVDEGVTSEAAIRAVVKDYFLSIIQGRLTVTVSDGLVDTMIDSDTLPELAASVSPELLALVQLAKWGAAQTLPVLRAPTMPMGGQSWDDLVFPDGEAAEAQASYLAGNPVFVEVPVTVQPLRGGPKTGTLRLYVKRTRPEEQHRPVFVRDSIFVKDALRRKVAGAVVIAHSFGDALAVFLGDAENVAHTDWQAGGERIRNNYRARTAGPCLGFVKEAPGAVLRLLTAQDAEEDPDLLKDIFGLELQDADEEPDSPTGQRKKGKGKVKAPVVAVESRPRRWLISPRAGGFVVTGTEAAKTPAKLRIRLGYDVRRGNPIANYDELDFVLGEGGVDPKEVFGASITHMSGNELILLATRDDFRVEVTGFDERRDLVVDVRAVAEATDD